MDKHRQSKIKIVTLVLAVLLGLSLLALSGTLLYKKLYKSKETVVQVPDNLIATEEEGTQTGTSDDVQNDTAEDSGNTGDAGIPSTGAEDTASAATISLYRRRAQDNEPFTVGNMFPGDEITKYFCVRVSYHDTVTVHYKAVIRQGYEKLAEVLKVKVRILNQDGVQVEMLYDGLMKEMPESLSKQLTSQKSTTDELYYEITAYLDTSVGNEYQNLSLIADFKWWVAEEGNLTSGPKTRDLANIVLWISLILFLIIICAGMLLFRRRKAGETDE